MSNPIVNQSATVSKRPCDAFIDVKTIKVLTVRAREIVSSPQTEYRSIMENNLIDIEKAETVEVPRDLLSPSVQVPDKGHFACGRVGPLAFRKRSGVASQLVNLLLKQDAKARVEDLHNSKFAARVIMNNDKQFREIYGSAWQNEDELKWNEDEFRWTFDTTPIRRIAPLSEKIMERTSNSFMVSGGSAYSVGRFIKAAPKRNRSGLKLITAVEALRAKVWSGIPDCRTLELESLSAYDDNSGRKLVRVVSGSDAGYPTLGKMQEENVLAKHQEILADFDLKTASCVEYEDYRKVLVELEKSAPYLFMHYGKSKTDVYKRSKIEDMQLRLYIVMPAWLRLAIQRGSQPLEGASENIISGDSDHEWRCVRTAQKVTLTRGGAYKLTLVLDAHLKRWGWSATTTGDDTWVNFRCGDYLITMSLDASNFDLTQVAEIVQPLREIIAEELNYIDETSAAVFRYITMEPRLIALFSIATYKMAHCGASGTPLQSKVNDMLMSVVIQRLVEAWKNDHDSWAFRDERDTLLWWREHVDKVGKSLGLDIRIEEYHRETFVDSIEFDGQSIKVSGLRHMLTKHPFLYIGYRFFMERTGTISVYQDLPRACANLLYPTQMWLKQDEFSNYEAVRLASTWLNMGYFPQSSVLSYDSNDFALDTDSTFARDLFDVDMSVLPMVLNNISEAKSELEIHLRPNGMYEAGVLFISAYCEHIRKTRGDRVLTDITTTSPFVGYVAEMSIDGTLNALKNANQLWRCSLVAHEGGDGYQSVDYGPSWHIVWANVSDRKNMYTIQERAEGVLRDWQTQEVEFRTSECGIGDDFDDQEHITKLVEVPMTKPRPLSVDYTLYRGMRRWGGVLDRVTERHGKMPPIDRPLSLKAQSAEALKKSILKNPKRYRRIPALERDVFWDEISEDLDTMSFVESVESVLTDDYKNRWELDEEDDAYSLESSQHGRRVAGAHLSDEEFGRLYSMA